MDFKVIHHGDQDGFMAAFLLGCPYLRSWSAFPEMIPVQYGDPVPWDKIKGNQVAIVDFSFTLPDMKRIAKESAHLVWVDHHGTSAHMVKELRAYSSSAYCLHRVGRSACGLVFSHIEEICKSTVIEDLMSGCSRHNIRHFSWLSNYIEDADLACYNLPNSYAINAYIRSKPMDVASYMSLAETFKEDMDKVIFAGKAILEAQSTQKDKVYDALTIVEEDSDGHKVAITNIAPFLPYRLATQIVRKMDPSVDYACDYVVQGGKVLLSFRSAESKMPVAPLAERLGGGGHDHAAGAKVPMDSGYAQFVLTANGGKK